MGWAGWIVGCVVRCGLVRGFGRVSLPYVVPGPVGFPFWDDDGVGEALFGVGDVGPGCVHRRERVAGTVNVVTC